ncbi:MAG: TM2 domain-containing protein [Cytophagales bacterium]|nr:MAG: TM2 domain-containing protein [Cytophagales bacterium]
MSITKPIPNKTTLIFAAIFLGVLGYDRYLLGYKNWWYKAIVMGGLGIWILYDLYLIISNKLHMADGRKVSE